MGAVGGELLTLGLAVAASPFPIIPAILLLFTPRARATGLAFLAGWVTGIVTGTVAFAMLSTAVEQGDEPAAWTSWARIGLGGVLLVLGARQWRDRGATEELPAWMESIEGSTPRKALRLGVVLSLANPKILLLSAAAGLAIGSADLTTVDTVVATAVFTAVAASTVALPVLLYAVLGDRILEPLGRLRTWLQQNNAALMSAVLMVIGVALVVKGVGSL